MTSNAVPDIEKVVKNDCTTGSFESSSSKIFTLVGASTEEEGEGSGSGYGSNNSRDNSKSKHSTHHRKHFRRQRLPPKKLEVRRTSLATEGIYRPSLF